MKKQWWLSSKKMTFWVETTDGKVSDAAPIARKFIGQAWYNLICWMKHQGGFKQKELKMPKIKIIHGDITEVQEYILPNFHFIFADPPFNIGHPYQGYDDRMEAGEYESWTWKWMFQISKVVRKNGIIALHGPDDVCELYLEAAHRMNLGRRIAWVNWHYRFGQCKKSNWIDARCHCLIYARGKTHTWNPEDVQVISDRVTYGDKRVQNSGGRRLPGTVWGIPSDGPNWGRVTGSHSNKERRSGHPNQLPEKYIERLLRAYTNPGDWVLDCFCGSGTVPTVAKALGRNCVAFDVSKSSVKSARQRVKKGAVRV